MEKDEGADEAAGGDVSDVMTSDNDARKNDGSGPSDHGRAASGVSGEVGGAEVEEEHRGPSGVTFSMEEEGKECLKP